MTIEDGEIVHVYLRYLVKQGRGVITVRLTQQCQKIDLTPFPLLTARSSPARTGRRAVDARPVQRFVRPRQKCITQALD